ncbi:hypothetical protein M9H77_02399 [Catharanthus roseus]|uniref:Uncharacterized protein n=1 Tax=Catharanthus roseus TaxID=4058 RepID=A0ACC0C899_CATRO|nr:hypothetical protein M9H77_02399 [Catharanthus roseus]
MFNKSGHNLDSLNVDIMLTRSSMRHKERNDHMPIDYDALKVHQCFFYYFDPKWLHLLFLSPLLLLLSMTVVAPIFPRLVAFVAYDETHLPRVI